MTKYLTVKDLIEELQKHPGDMRVFVQGRARPNTIKKLYIDAFELGSDDCPDGLIFKENQDGAFTDVKALIIDTWKDEEGDSD